MIGKRHTIPEINEIERPSLREIKQSMSCKKPQGLWSIEP